MFNHCREYFDGDLITYVCLDSMLGADGGPNQVRYRCIHETSKAVGYYDVPKNISEWPYCIKRTTTIQPGTKLIRLKKI